MDLHALGDPVFVAKLVNFVVFVGALVFVYRKWGNPWLVASQEAQNKAVEDAQAELERARASVEAARQAVEQAKTDAARMVEVAKAQAERTIVEDKTAAQQHALRIVAHAQGELERERYRVRRELLEETVERATGEARKIVKRDLTSAKQHELVEGLVSSLEARHS